MHTGQMTWLGKRELMPEAVVGMAVNEQSYVQAGEYNAIEF
jgi:hypothetical protein